MQLNTSTMILAYSRPFSCNDSKANSKIPDLGGKVLRNLNNEEKDLHKWLLDQRNTLIAHTDSEAVDLKFEVYDIVGQKYLRPIRNRNTKYFALEYALPFKALASKMLNYVVIERKNIEPEMIHLLGDDDIEEIISVTQQELENSKTYEAHN